MSVYLPDSKIPFKPMNPWGRPMPKPSRTMRKAPLPLFQVFVEETKTGKHLAVGPKMEQEQAEKFCEAIGVMIGRGLEKTWATPTVVQFSPI